MSLLKFKCHVCGYDIKKLRASRDIIFDINKKRPLVCKHCGCKYKISAVVDWIVGLTVELVFIVACFLAAFFVAYWLAIAIDNFFEIELDGLWVLIAAFIFFVSSVLVGIHFISSMLPLKKLEQEGQ
ncbi:MAG: hypothetical protein LBQ18_02780 [Campylobacteraceae bacterium]|jgi:hypothetical protein|nr:hypothetical protein [Campylobacteraceae bacterium]